jgi:hypothetical protein
MDWMYEVPTWVLASLIVGGFVLLGIGGLAATSALASRVVGDPDAYKGAGVGDFVAATAVLFGLVAALLTVAVWQNYNELDARVAQEAASMGALYRLAQDLPQPSRDELAGAIKALTRDVITTEWAEQRDGVLVNRADLLIDMRKTISRFAPANEAQSNLQKVLHTEFDKTYELRRDRRHNVNTGVPGALYAVVILSGLNTIALTWFLPVNRPRLHGIMTGITAAMIGMVVFTIVAVDKPFRGAISIGPEAFEDSYYFLMDGEPLPGFTAPPPG